MWDWTQSLSGWTSEAGSVLKTLTLWTVLGASVFLALVGVFVPVIPGAIVLLVGAALFAWLEPGWLSWWTVGALAVLAVLDRVVDIGSAAVGTKWFGGTKWGMFGALVGGLVGLFFGIFGLILGPVIGAAAFEIIWAKRHPREAARSGVGAGVGFGLSMAGRLFICLVMIGALVTDLILNGG